MAGYDFPNTPVDGQKFSPSGGPTYVYVAAAQVWKFDSVYVGATIPEAPLDGKTYGRQNEAWNPALAISNDVLDGGNF